MVSDHESKPFLQHFDETSGVDNTQSYEQHRSRFRGSFLSYGFLFFVTSLVWLLVMFFLISTPALSPTALTASSSSSSGFNVTSNRRKLTCGNSTEEAVAKGCKYDASLRVWLAAPCFDQAWVDDYLTDGSSTAYADRNLTKRISHAEMLERGFYWSSFRDHLNHCAAGWKRQSQAFFEDRPALDGSIINTKHAAHCTQLFMNAALETKKIGSTENIIGYLDCWIRD